MKLSNETLEVLSNFTNINDNLVINAPEDDESGTLIRTKNVASNVFAEYKAPEVFPCDISIYNLSELLSVIGLFDDPDLEFGEKYLTINDSSSSNRVRYFYADRSILSYPEKGINFPESDLTVTLGTKEFAKIKKAASTLGVPNVSVLGDENDVTLRAHDTGKQSGNYFDLGLEAASDPDRAFQVDFTTDTLNLLPVEYELDLSFKGISRFANESYGLTYYIAMKVQTN